MKDHAAGRFAGIFIASLATSCGRTDVSAAQPPMVTLTRAARENESSVVKRDGQLVWHPAECDDSIRTGWFQHPDEDSKVKCLATLSDIYFKSSGRNAVLLLNIPLDRRGRIASESLPVRGGRITVPVKAFAPLSLRLGLEP